ncbi:hypothetical protein EVAR_64142_1 [Eumeta japonica]|uniref:Uncharacterized protein n=1 Tax=Eumeta variegata TaxID=151549 RepID=A0A4C2A5X0_EUMVA|nr:hypothetical protein EVAR_64142_1 [Eumeta japonica]
MIVAPSLQRDCVLRLEVAATIDSRDHKRSKVLYRSRCQAVNGYAVDLGPHTSRYATVMWKCDVFHANSHMRPRLLRFRALLDETEYFLFLIEFRYRYTSDIRETPDEDHEQHFKYGTVYQELTFQCLTLPLCHSFEKQLSLKKHEQEA